ncbi:MAG: Protein translocase subunit SecD [Microgenomates group bacterium GW2011_GWA1_48_10]|nr:MAG: Protein translocase subunit SecD [Microgenomates group bacterium GW2011_GWA1_48_10]
MSNRFLIGIIFLLTVAAVFVDLPSHLPRLNFQLGSIKVDRQLERPALNLGNAFVRDLEIKEGLDLAGGTHLTLQVDMSKISPADRSQALEALQGIIRRRVDLYGVSEPVVQTAKVGQDYRLIVELAGVTNLNEAIGLIGKTAQLTFRESVDASEAAKVSTESALLYGPFQKETNLTGKDLKIAKPGFDQNTGEPIVELTFNSEGTEKWADITTSGALPAPVHIVEQRTIGATLGQQSIDKSLLAGAIGLTIVAVFMLANYGKLGLFADLALIIYTLLVFALFKLIPITLTLAGIAGFILSIGMAVDANILIFERMKEELRWGRNRLAAIEAGFNRAFPSIRDSNASTLITCAILYWFGTGPVRGFALTLAVGVLVSLFTAITVTRTFLRTFESNKSN